MQIRRICELRDLENKNKKMRGYAAQQSRRELERKLRIEVVAFARWTHLQHITLHQAAGRVGLSSRTLLTWEQGWKMNQLHTEARGRPAQRSDRETRDGVMAIFQLMGPGVGLSVLQEFFPAAARRELEDLQRKYREAHLKKSRVLVYALRWQRVGAVWAMDFTEPPAAVDGIYPSILVVRDLASGVQLMAMPVAGETAEETIAGLQSLFREHGEPLVIKSDNGSGFIACAVESFLEQHGVNHLLSPPRLPSYNGACESGIGSLKVRAHHESARHDRPGEWTCDDVEAARLMANETSRPGGFHSPTPNERWRIRLLLSVKERESFQTRLDGLRNEVRIELGCLPGIDIGPAMRATVDRRAITRALVAQGILNFRRRRITLPISIQKLAIIS
jgi:transposase InsO family protein